MESCSGFGWVPSKDASTCTFDEDYWKATMALGGVFNMLLSGDDLEQEIKFKDSAVAVMKDLMKMLRSLEGKKMPTIPKDQIRKKLTDAIDAILDSN